MFEKFFKTKKPVIVTHSGTFHTDDCFAVAALLLSLGKEVHEVELVRSRDTKDFERADFVVDVGDIYDPEKNRFDHHQEGGAGKRENNIPYAAFGLVWKKFGEKIADGAESAKKIDNALVAPIDAHDNGITITKSLVAGVYPYSLDQFVFKSNPSWKEDETAAFSKFVETMQFCKKILEKEVAFLQDTMEARQAVLKEYAEARDKRIVILSKDYPWKEIIGELPETLFVVYPRRDGSWGIKGVRNSVAEFTNRKDFPLAWAGKREALAEITGVPDAIFCHNARFMAVAKSKEGAIELAKLAIESL